jgi:hypothetical protein
LVSFSGLWHGEGAPIVVPGRSTTQGDAVAPHPAHPSVLIPQPAAASDPALVQVIDLHTAEPAELERLLQRWRSTALAAEHLTRAEVARDDSDRGHLVLKIEYEPTSIGRAGLCASTSPEAGLVAALLDRPPRFRTPVST